MKFQARIEVEVETDGPEKPDTLIKMLRECTGDDLVDSKLLCECADAKERVSFTILNVVIEGA